MIAHTSMRAPSTLCTPEIPVLCVGVGMVAETAGSMGLAGHPV